MNAILKNIIFLSAFLLISNPSNAQNQNTIDSLLQTVSIAKNTQKVQILSSLAWEYRNFDPDKSIQYGEQALKLAQKSQNNKGVSYSLRVIGLAYRSKLDYIRARKYLFLALPFAEKSDNHLEVAQCLLDIGEIYKLRGDYKQALDKYKRSVEIFEEVQYKEGTAKALSGIADVYYKLAKYQTALRFALKALMISQNSNTDEGVKEASLILSEAYATVGNYQEAYHYYLLHTSVKDSVFLMEKSKEIHNLERTFIKERKAQVDKINREKAAEKAITDKKRSDNVQYSFIFIIFILLFGVIFALGKFDIPQYTLESIIFLTLLLLFRFILIMIMPFADVYAEGSPMMILVANVVLALMFMPLHKFLEKILKKKVINEHQDEEKIKMSTFIKDKLTNRKKKLSK
jgi:ATP/maltotriose-dependent transcriptional regulator MalT